MLLDTLTTRSSDLGPDARYCLARFASRFEYRESEGLSTKEMAKSFGVSESVMSASFKALIAVGALIIRSELTGKKGRAGRFYRASKEWVKGDLGSCHLGVISALLERPRESAQTPVDYPSEVGGGGEQLKKARAQARGRAVRDTRQLGRLSNVNRLIMAVLLCRADRLGAVRTLGHADLVKMTGLTSERLGNRIKTLLSRGLIRAYVPGATSTALFKPTKSMYLLNLGHPDLTATPQLVTTIVLDYPWTGERVEGEASIWFGHQATADDRFFRFFVEKNQMPVLRIFQARIDEYASCFLSTNWQSLDDKPHNPNFSLKQQIKADFQLPRSTIDSEADTFPDVSESKRLMNSLYSTALQKAQRIKEVMLSVAGPDFKSMDHLILPSPLVHDRGHPVYPFISVLSAASATNEGGCRVFDFRESPLPMFFSMEQDIPLEDRYCYGLLTPPEGQLIVAAGDGIPCVVRQ